LPWLGKTVQDSLRRYLILGRTLYLASQIFTAFISCAVVVAYFFSPIFLIVKLAKSKRFGRVKKIIIFVLIVGVFYLVTTRLLIFVGNEIDKSINNAHGIY
jgi:hypothetical protein